jgi:hypothetical protein
MTWERKLNQLAINKKSGSPALHVMTAQALNRQSLVFHDSSIAGLFSRKLQLDQMAWLWLIRRRSLTRQNEQDAVLIGK